ncbi:hypothetical protein V5799_016142 [Amblyomma americanum]|uniref:Uncharacterized protein n=1 Tax=Amblyomma americanum TaxID=6943 RepID=A0AAQ4F5Y2_AMBAM
MKTTTVRMWKGSIVAPLWNARMVATMDNEHRHVVDDGGNRESRPGASLHKAANESEKPPSPVQWSKGKEQYYGTSTARLQVLQRQS